MSEAIYDAEIAPELLRLCKRCEDAGISFICRVEWAPGEGGRTVSLQANASLEMRITEMAAKPGFNIDGFAIALARYTREHNLPHSSIVLNQFGLEPDPAERKP